MKRRELNGLTLLGLKEKPGVENRVGWFEYNWKMIIGAAWCRRFGHRKGPGGRCRRCLWLWSMLTREQQKRGDRDG